MCPSAAQAAIDRTRAYSLAADATLAAGAAGQPLMLLESDPR